MEVKRGNIFLVDLNPVIGTEQAGIRPALIVQTDRANIKSPHTIIIPFTTRIRETILPSHVKIVAGSSGLMEDSILLCEQIRVIDKRRLIRKIGNIAEDNLKKVALAIKIVLGLD